MIEGKWHLKAKFLLREHKTKQAANGQVSAIQIKGRLAVTFQKLLFQGSIIYFDTGDSFLLSWPHAKLSLHEYMFKNYC